MNKRGQFFLIVALIIVSILASFGVIYNSATAMPEDSKIPVLAEEIKYESIKLIDNQYYYNVPDVENSINNKILALAGEYSKSNLDTKIVIIYGRKGNLQIKQFINGNEQAFNTGDRMVIAEKAEVSFEGEEYFFDIDEGYNFHDIIKKEVNDETFVAYA